MFLTGSPAAEPGFLANIDKGEARRNGVCAHTGLFSARSGLFFVLLFALLLAPLSASAQQISLSRENIPHIPTDTLPTDRGEVRIVTFSDGTFRFVPTNPYHFRSAPAYTERWDTLNLFPYHDVPLRRLAGRTTIVMGENHGFRAPATGRVLSRYGPRGRRPHNGIDIQVYHGQPIFAAFDGIVRFSRWNSGGYGNLVIIRHPNGLETYYAHLSRRAVVADEWVRAGQVIGYGGRTGRASANHLHFEVRYSDQSFDPERIIDFGRGRLKHRKFTLRKDYFNIRSRAGDKDPEEEPEGSAASVADSLASTEGEMLDEEWFPADSLTAAAYADSLAAAQAPPRPSPADPVYHKIQRGDTLLALALKYNTSVARICELNGIKRTTTLRIGRDLRVR